MAGDWIKMRANLRHDPAVIGIAHNLDSTENEVVGLLHSFWSWVDQHSRDGAIPGVTLAWIDRFTESDGFAQALMDVGWLNGSDGDLTVPNFERHNGSSAKKRAQATVRKQKSRSERDKSVTREEKSREERVVKKKAAPRADLMSVLAEPEFKSLNTPEFIELWEEWISYRKERGLSTYVERSLKALLRKAQEAGYASFKEAVNNAIEQGWQGVFPRGAGRTTTNNGRATGQSRSSKRGDYPEPERRGPAKA